MTGDEVIEAEQACLGAALISPHALDDIAAQLGPGDFWRPAHGIIFEAALALRAQGCPADPVTVAAQLRSTGQAETAGGATYLHTLTASVPAAASGGYYARLVSDAAVLRRIGEAGQRIAQLADGPGGAEWIAHAAHAALNEATGPRPGPGDGA